MRKHNAKRLDRGTNCGRTDLCCLYRRKSAAERRPQTRKALHCSPLREEFLVRTCIDYIVKAFGMELTSTFESHRFDDERFLRSKRKCWAGIRCGEWWFGADKAVFDIWDYIRSEKKSELHANAAWIITCIVKEMTKITIIFAVEIDLFDFRMKTLRFSEVHKRTCLPLYRRT